MNSTYFKINRLKAQGWTWSRFIEELDCVSATQIELKTLKANASQPHRKAGAHVEEAINSLYDIHFPSLYPPALEGLLRLGNASRVELDSPSPALRHMSGDLEAFLNWLLSQDQPRSALEEIRLWWVYGNLAFDRIAYYRDNPSLGNLEATKNEAILRYKHALDQFPLLELDSEYDQQLSIDQYKLMQNILACYFNSVLSSERDTNTQWQEFIKEYCYFERSNSLIETFPFDWLVPRNALRFASLLGDSKLVQKYYSKLCQANNRFEDLGYEPSMYPSIRVSGQFEFALAVIEGK